MNLFRKSFYYIWPTFFYSFSNYILPDLPNQESNDYTPLQISFPNRLIYSVSLTHSCTINIYILIDCHAIYSGHLDQIPVNFCNHRRPISIFLVIVTVVCLAGEMEWNQCIKIQSGLKFVCFFIFFVRVCLNHGNGNANLVKLGVEKWVLVSVLKEKNSRSERTVLLVENPVQFPTLTFFSRICF